MSRDATRRKVTLLVAAASLAVASFAAGRAVAQPAGGAQKPDAAKQDARKAEASKPPPPRKFRPPPGAPPATRTKGAVRSKDDKNAPPGEVVVLAPDGVMGYTTRERPVLFWSLSRPTDQPVQITINDLKTGESVVDVTLEGGQRAGVHRFDTSKLEKAKDFKLEPGVQYEWVVLVPRPEGVNARSARSICRLMRMDPAKVPAVSESSGPAERARAYADAGVWFDYLTALDDAIATDPQNVAWREARDAALAAEKLPVPDRVAR